MKHLSDRYRKVITHKGIDVCTLKVAIPSQGDKLGYKIDDKGFKDSVFEDVSDAIAAIESFYLMGLIKITGFLTFPEMREYKNTDEGRERVRDDLFDLTDNEILAIDASDWCELATVGELYENEDFAVEIIEY